MIFEKEENNCFCQSERGAIQTAEKPRTTGEISPLSV